MTNDFLQQDIFFFVTTIAVVLVGVLLSIFIIQLIRISRKIDRLTNKASQQAELLSEDIAELRSNIKSGGMRISYLVGFWKNLFKKSKK